MLFKPQQKDSYHYNVTHNSLVTLYSFIRGQECVNNELNTCC